MGRCAALDKSISYNPPPHHEPLLLCLIHRRLYVEKRPRREGGDRLPNWIDEKLLEGFLGGHKKTGHRSSDMRFDLCSNTTTCLNPLLAPPCSPRAH